MNEISELFAKIGRDDIDPQASGLLKNGIIDSIDIMALVTQIEKTYKKTLDAKFLEVKNFESFESIKAMIQEAMT